MFRGRNLQSVPQLRLEGELYQVGVPGLIAQLGARLPAAYYSGSVSLGAVDRAALAGIANNGVTVEFDNFTAKGAPVPPLTEPLVSVGRAVVLRWPAATLGWVLEGAPQVEGPWSKVAGSAEIVGTENRLSIEGPSGAQFYRLRKP